MHLGKYFIIFLTKLICVSLASNGNNYFTNPASNNGINPVWTLGDEQLISWRTTLDVFNVSIWQQSLVEQGASSQGNVYCMSANERNVFTRTKVPANAAQQKSMLLIKSPTLLGLSSSMDLILLTQMCSSYGSTRMAPTASYRVISTSLSHHLLPAPR